MLEGPPAALPTRSAAMPALVDVVVALLWGLLGSCSAFVFSIGAPVPDCSSGSVVSGLRFFVRQAASEETAALAIVDAVQSYPAQYAAVTSPSNCSSDALEAAVRTLSGTCPFLLAGVGFAEAQSIAANDARRILVHASVTSDGIPELALPYVYGITTSTVLYVPPTLKAMMLNGILRVAIAWRPAAAGGDPQLAAACASATATLPSLQQLQPGMTLLNFTYSNADADAPGFFPGLAKRILAAGSQAVVACDTEPAVSELAAALLGSPLLATFFVEGAANPDFLQSYGGFPYALSAVQWSRTAQYGDRVFGSAAAYARGFEEWSGGHTEPDAVAAGASAAALTLAFAVERAFVACTIAADVVATGDVERLLFDPSALSCPTSSASNALGWARAVEGVPQRLGTGPNGSVPGVVAGGGLNVTGYDLIMHVLAQSRFETFYGPVEFSAVHGNVAKPPLTTQVLPGTGGLHVVMPLEAASALLVMPVPLPGWSDQGSNTMSPGAILGIVVGCILVITLVVLYVIHRRQGRRHRNLFGQVRPPGVSPQTTLVVTDIESSTTLWESLPANIMEQAMEVHDTSLRALAAAHDGYESANEGDSFVLAFHDPFEAVLFAVKAQQKLLLANWPEALLRHEKADVVFMTLVPDGALVANACHMSSWLTQLVTVMHNKAITAHTVGGGNSLSLRAASLQKSVLGAARSMRRRLAASFTTSSPSMNRIQVSPSQGDLRGSHNGAFVPGIATGLHGTSAGVTAASLADGAASSSDAAPLAAALVAPGVVYDTGPSGSAVGGPGRNGGGGGNSGVPVVRTLGNLSGAVLSPVEGGGRESASAGSPLRRERDQEQEPGGAGGQAGRHPPLRHSLSQPGVAPSQPGSPRHQPPSAGLPLSPAPRQLMVSYSHGRLWSPTAGTLTRAGSHARSFLQTGFSQGPSPLQQASPASPLHLRYQRLIHTDVGAADVSHPQGTPAAAEPGAPGEPSSPFSAAPAPPPGPPQHQLKSSFLGFSTALHSPAALPSAATAAVAMSAGRKSLQLAPWHAAAAGREPGLLSSQTLFTSTLAPHADGGGRGSASATVVSPSAGMLSSGDCPPDAVAGRLLSSLELAAHTVEVLLQPEPPPSQATTGVGLGAVATERGVDRGLAEEGAEESRDPGGVQRMPEPEPLGRRWLSEVELEEEYGGGESPGPGPVAEGFLALNPLGGGRRANGNGGGRGRFGSGGPRASGEESGGAGAGAGGAGRLTDSMELGPEEATGPTSNISASAAAAIAAMVAAAGGGGGGVAEGGRGMGGAGGGGEGVAASTIAAAAPSAPASLRDHVPGFRGSAVALDLSTLYSGNSSTGQTLQGRMAALGQLGLGGLVAEDLTTAAEGDGEDGGVVRRNQVLGQLLGSMFRRARPSDRPRFMAHRGLRVRMGLHSGLTDPHAITTNKASGRTQYGGSFLTVAKRTSDAANGGQITLTEDTYRQIPARSLLHRAWVLQMGHHHLGEFYPFPEEDDDCEYQLYQVLGYDLAGRLPLLPPLRTPACLISGALSAPVGTLTIAFMYVHALQALMSWNSQVTTEAMELFHRVASYRCKDHGGYVSEGQEGLVLAAFRDPAQALLWALNTQQALISQPWDPELLEHELAEEVSVLVPAGELTAGEHTHPAGAAAGATTPALRSTSTAQQPQHETSPLPKVNNNLASGGSLAAARMTRSHGGAAPAAAVHHGVEIGEGRVSPVGLMAPGRSSHVSGGGGSRGVGGIGNGDMSGGISGVGIGGGLAPVVGLGAGGGAAGGMPVAQFGIGAAVADMYGMYEDDELPPGMVRKVLMRGLRMRVGLDVGRLNESLSPVSSAVVYRGKAMNRAARIGMLASASQILCSAAAWTAARNSTRVDWAARFNAVSLGRHVLRGVSEPIEVIHCRLRTPDLEAVGGGGAVMGAGAGVGLRGPRNGMGVEVAAAGAVAGNSSGAGRSTGRQELTSPLVPLELDRDPGGGGMPYEARVTGSGGGGGMLRMSAARSSQGVLSFRLPSGLPGIGSSGSGAGSGRGGQHFFRRSSAHSPRLTAGREAATAAEAAAAAYRHSSTASAPLVTLPPVPFSDGAHAAGGLQPGHRGDLDGPPGGGDGGGGTTAARPFIDLSPAALQPSTGSLHSHPPAGISPPQVQSAADTSLLASLGPWHLQSNPDPTVVHTAVAAIAGAAPPAAAASLSSPGGGDGTGGGDVDRGLAPAEGGAPTLRDVGAAAGGGGGGGTQGSRGMSGGMRFSGPTAFLRDPAAVREAGPADSRPQRLLGASGSGATGGVAPPSYRASPHSGSTNLAASVALLSYHDRTATGPPASITGFSSGLLYSVRHAGWREGLSAAVAALGSTLGGQPHSHSRSRRNQAGPSASQSAGGEPPAARLTRRRSVLHTRAAAAVEPPVSGGRSLMSSTSVGRSIRLGGGLRGEGGSQRRMSTPVLDMLLGGGGPSSPPAARGSPPPPRRVTASQALRHLPEEDLDYLTSAGGGGDGFGMARTSTGGLQYESVDVPYPDDAFATGGDSAAATDMNVYDNVYDNNVASNSEEDDDGITGGGRGGGQRRSIEVQDPSHRGRRRGHQGGIGHYERGYPGRERGSERGQSADGSRTRTRERQRGSGSGATAQGRARAGGVRRSVTGQEPLLDNTVDSSIQELGLGVGVAPKPLAGRGLQGGSRPTPTGWARGLGGEGGGSEDLVGMTVVVPTFGDDSRDDNNDRTWHL